MGAGGADADFENVENADHDVFPQCWLFVWRDADVVCLLGGLMCRVVKARFHTTESLRILVFFVGRMMRGLPSQKYTALSCFAGRADSGVDSGADGL